MKTLVPISGSLHGHTLVVDTEGPQVFVGRCDKVDSRYIHLREVAEHRDGEGGLSKVAYLRDAAQLGVRKNFDDLSVSRDKIVSVRQLADLLEGSTVTEPNASNPLSSPEGAGPQGQAAAKKFQVVELTPSAQEEVRRLLDEEGKPGHGLRLGIMGGGCSGLSYRLEFGPQEEGDLVLNYLNFEVFLDKKSAIYLRGTTLDHQKGLVGKGFVFKNPNATNTCGCGESFSV